MAYVYRHIRLDTNQPFYIGKGVDVGFYRAFDKSRRNKHWQNIASSVGMRVDILFDDISEVEAKQKEVEFIALYGRADLGLGTLINLTDGGDGGKNWLMTPAQRIKLSENVKEQYRTGSKQPAAAFPNRKGIPMAEPQRLAMCKKVGMFSPDGKMVAEFMGTTLAAKHIGGIQTKIVQCCLGNRKTHMGYIWKYL